MTEITWKYEKRSIDELIENKDNPRRLSKKRAEELKASLSKFGLCQPIVIQPDGKIAGGHQRLKTLKKLGFKDVPVAIPSRVLSEREFKELTIRLNKSIGEWDYDALANTWDPQDLLDWGFDEKELAIDIQELLGKNEDEDGGLLEPTKDPKTKLGDIYQLGNHRFICGDSTLPETVQQLLDGEEPILLLTDPPYNLAKENKLVAKNCSKSIKNLKESKWDQNFDIDLWTKTFPLEYFKNASFYVFTSHHLAPKIWEWMKEWSNHYSWCVWQKTNPMPSLMKRISRSG